MNFCCFKAPAAGDLSWQPRKQIHVGPPGTQPLAGPNHDPWSSGAFGPASTSHRKEGCPPLDSHWSVPKKRQFFSLPQHYQEQDSKSRTGSCQVLRHGGPGGSWGELSRSSSAREGLFDFLDPAPVLHGVGAQIYGADERRKGCTQEAAHAWGLRGRG